MRRRVLPLLLLLLALPVCAHAAAPVFDAASFPGATGMDWVVGAASVTWTHTVTGANPAICVGSLTGNQVTGVTYNGVALTSEWNNNFVGVLWASKYCLLNPATGAHSVVVTLSGSAGYAMEATSYTGVGSFGTIATATGVSNAPSVTSNAAAGDLTLDGVAYFDGSNNPVVGGGQTQRNNIYNSVNGRGVASSEKAGATPTMTWTLTNNPSWYSGAVPLKPPTSGIRHRAIQQ